MLPTEIIYLSTDHELHVVDIPYINNSIKIQLDDYLVSICEGESENELFLVKIRLLEFLSNKTVSTQMGAIAELFVHLYLRINGYKQEFLFFNLEEGSIKKGFDGLFTKDSNMYLLESKSGSVLTKANSHKVKLIESYNDLDKYVSGKSEKGKNNPWKNAYNHASHVDVSAKKDIRKKIQELQNNYDLKSFSSINKFNIIPCSTIFLNDVWDASISSEILQKNDFILSFKGNTNKVICITKSSLNTFKKYLEV